MSSDPSKPSYSQILKSSVIVGGAQGIELLIRMVRIKFVAILLGPSGVGLVGLYESTIELAGKLSGLGIRSSGVRQVAEAHGSGDLHRLGRTVKVLRRTCIATGMAGWLLMIAFSRPLSKWVFESSERASALALLGAVLLIDSVSNGQTALLQGTRRIGDLARIMIASAIGSTVISVSLYAWLGEQGIVPVVIASAIMTLGFSWWFSNKVTAPIPVMKPLEIVREAQPLLSLGLAFMWGGILGAGLGFVIRALVIQTYGVDASGIYQAAWGISGLFAGFVLSAMGQDFYPRLTAVGHHNESINRLVNEQTEVGLLLALPGLLATLAFSPWVIEIFYTSKFIKAAEMLPWFVLGVFGRVIAWPMGFIQLAKGASKIFAATETAFNSLYLLFVWLGLNYMGLVGVSAAFAMAYACHSAIVFWVAVRLSGFRWSRSSWAMIGFSAAFVVLVFCSLKLFTGIAGAVINSVIVLYCGIFCLRRLTVRLGPDHRISRMVSRIPCLGRCFKLKPLR